MPSQPPNFITAIDVGSAKTCVLVAEIGENGLRYRGHGISRIASASRKGVITNSTKPWDASSRQLKKPKTQLVSPSNTRWWESQAPTSAA